MAVCSVFIRFCTAFFLMTVLSACSSVSEEEIFGYEYEENFIIPQPDMVPVTPDDKPGRTVDEMLNLKQAVTVKQAVYQDSEKQDQMYEHAGRFGSKEKIALRKGLNAPDTGIVYSSHKRRETEVVRPLELKEQEKDKLLTVSEEEMLAEIIAPKTEKVEEIEVVSSDETEKESFKEAAKTVSSVPTASSVDCVDVSQRQGVQDPVAFKPQKDVSEAVVLEPLVQKQPSAKALPFVKRNEIELKAPVQENEVISTPSVNESEIVLTPPVMEDKIMLTPPAGENRIILTPPSAETSETSVEIFL